MKIKPIVSQIVLCMVITSSIRLASSKSDCKLHFQSKISDICDCCDARSNEGEAIKCKQDDLFIGYSNSFCLTWNNKTQHVEISRCLFIHKDSLMCNRVDFSNIYSKLDSNLTDLTNVTCGVYNREGPHCRQCIHGYGPAAFSDGVTCADCSKHKHMWILNLLFQLAMVTLMYIAVILFQIKGTSSPFNIIIAFGQVGINAAMIGTGIHIKLTCLTTKFFTDPFIAILGVVNLDFLCFVIPPLCISSSLKSITVLLFDYVIALYPIILTTFIYICIELHDRNYKLIVCLTYPLKYLQHRNWNPKETVLNTCASFLLLSYSKFLFVSCRLFLSVHTYNCSGKTIFNQTVLLYDPAIKFLNSEHIPYAILALFVIVIFVLLPPFLLLLYPTRLFRKCLSCCGFQRWDILHLIMDIFQGWYKDGTEGTYDYRSLSSLYMLLRITFAALYISIIQGLGQFWVKYITGVSHVFLAMTFLIVKPYKTRWMSHFDAIILLLFGTIVLTFYSGKSIVLIEIVLALSLIVLSCSYVVFKCIQKAFAQG